METKKNIKYYRLLQRMHKALKEEDFEAATEVLNEEKGTPEAELIRKEIRDEGLKYSLDMHLLPNVTLMNNDAVAFTHELAVNFSKDLNCKTSYERALSDATVASYARIFDYSKRLQDCNNIKLFPLYSRELDKAYKNFINCLVMLKKIKKIS